MSARTRARRRIQPYAWLGAGAVTVGMGAALIGGTAVAFAETGSDAGDHTSVGASNDTASTKSEASKQKTLRGPKAKSAGAASDSSESTAPVRRGHDRPSTAVTAQSTPEATPDVETSSDTAPVADNPRPAASVAPATKTRRGATPVAVTSAPDPVPSVNDSPAVADPSPAASVPGPADAPAPSTTSWLPDTPIVPGEKVKLALFQIVQSRDLLNEQTWGSGNILGGIGALGPQAALSTAQLMLTIWATSISNAQAFSANTAGNPLFHWIAQANLQNELLYPKLSDLSLATASLLIPTLKVVGVDTTEVETLVTDARQNGKVYAKVPIKIVADTEPVVGVKINGGSKATLLVDTGASGLVTTADKIGSAQPLGQKTGEGNSCFSGGICYHYDTYNTTVDLGDGAVATAPVNIVTDNDQYPDSVQTFKDFFSWGADGILGVGANTAGPGPKPIPTAAMPGELSDGVLIYQNAYPFGLGGYMILGPNLFPTRVSVPGAPDAYVKVSINGGAKQDAGAIIDSGGVYGTLNRDLFPQQGTYVPAGTKIDVYTADGSILLYSYTTQGGEYNQTPYIEEGLFNTGNAPYAQGPIYLNYGATPYGIGSTDFSIA